ncbi:alkane hydroxylase MAH1 [Ricinus communis]|uniref:alkane hydroxylase MAH1 n=1 Tax=Ricinus communis TaxID=3988 RepID=UPI00201A4A4C|nr:alkane hydroxylase MAH1 [Ricinus communis]
MIGCTEMAIALLSIIFLRVWWRSRGLVVTNWPVVGMIPGLLFRPISSVHDFATYVLQRSGGTLLFQGPWFSGMNFLMTSDPMNVQYIVSKNFANYPKGPDFRQIFEVLGDGIFNVDSDSWRIQRRIMHSLLKSKRFHLAVERTVEHKILKGLFVVLDNVSELASEVDIQDVFQRFTFDSICILALSYDPDSLSIEFPHVPFAKAFDDIEEAVLYRYLVPSSIWKLQKRLRIGKEKKLRNAWDTFDRFLEQCITRKREQVRRSKNQKERDQDYFDLLTYYFMEVEGGDVNVPVKSNKLLRDTATALLIAGRDTVSAALAWFFWLIGTHPSAEKKILEEIKAKVQPDTNDEWRHFSLEALNKLVYLHAAICETLRLYPSIPINHKMSVEADVLPSGHRVPGNTRILYFLYSMGRMEEIWGKDCSEFKPERWICEKGQIKHIPSYKYIAFNAGPRTCLGKDLTFLQMKIVASAIIWNYSLQVVDNRPATPCNSVVLHMKGGLKVRVSKRWDS